ncbi:MAG: RdgB/HAM1 family non-canonical purine NTP pyrophosphatase [Oscillospiraceae bacterium]|nr:RdgB/HAM1 family non-canonical purine NTP pyrophosphatase [Oscillospiraceae bacterium]
MKLILASNNKDKLREFKEILEPLGFDIRSQREEGINIEAEETGETFFENSAIKAQAVYDIAHCPVIADDSGLEVDYLGGEPGVYSARYGGEDVDDIGRCYLVLDRLKGVPDEKRTARFVAVISYIDENGKLSQFKGTIEGRIGYDRRGEHGFGYDPIFMVGDRSTAEISPEEKNKISHRGKALMQLKEFLEMK